MAVGLWLSVSLVYTSTALQHGHALEIWAPVFAAVGVTGAALSIPILYLGARTLAGRAKRRLLWVALAALVAAGVQSIADAMAHALVEQAFNAAPASRDWPHTIGFNLMLYAWIYALYASAVALVFALLKTRGAEHRLLQLQSSGDRARLEALKMQVNPHFLFNALNAAVSLIGLDRSTDAEAVLLRLAKLFRSSMGSPSDDVASLADEFDIITAYLEIESIRFGSRLSMSIDLPAHLENAVWPRFLLQPLVEMAINHGTANADRRVAIAVKAVADGDRLVVTVELARPPGGMLAGRTGDVTAARERLEMRYGPEAGVETGHADGLFVTRIHLPLALMPN